MKPGNAGAHRRGDAGADESPGGSGESEDAGAAPGGEGREKIMKKARRMEIDD